VGVDCFRPSQPPRRFSSACVKEGRGVTMGD
jgi:hypothetical protein